MLNILANSFLRATHQDTRETPRWDAPKHWRQDHPATTHKRHTPRTERRDD